MGVLDGTRLMRDSVGVVRQNAALLWFPVISTICLALLAGFWILWGASLYEAHHGWSLALVPLVVAGLYSLSFVGVFFSVALAGTASEAVEGSEPSLGDGIDIAFDCLGAIAAWAAMSLFVAFVLGLFKSRAGRALGAAAQTAWSFATLFVVPIIALEDVGAEGARRRSFQLSRQNWQRESGGLVALRAALLVPGAIIYFDWKLLAGGHVHSVPGKALLLLVLLCGIGVSVAASVVRQVFAVTLYRDSAGPATA
ncbi:MAG TPA: DUF6159 family protein [Gaiellaceae bacterium]|jgi:hypothetical protein